jgi:hypothetical protein
MRINQFHYSPFLELGPAPVPEDQSRMTYAAVWESAIQVNFLRRDSQKTLRARHRSLDRTWHIPSNVNIKLLQPWTVSTNSHQTPLDHPCRYLVLAKRRIGGTLGSISYILHVVKSMAQKSLYET